MIVQEFRWLARWRACLHLEHTLALLDIMRGQHDDLANAICAGVASSWQIPRVVSVPRQYPSYGDAGLAGHAE